ncbi:MAG: polysaccharide deacetylase family protein [Chloroflexi bacterium]|nr:polysaccharide deacetylase family protein [Chloroflexota bacterium]
MTGLRETVARAARHPAFKAAVSLLERLDRGRDGVLGVLTYHRVDSPSNEPDLYPGLISAEPRDFEDQMTLLSLRYRVISLEELLAVRQGASLPRRAVMVTFDDAYKDFEEQAWPVLARLSLPATLFVPTDFPDRIDGGFWWDRLYAAFRRTGQSKSIIPSLGSASLLNPRERRTAYDRLREHTKTLPHDDAMETVEDTIRTLGVDSTENPVLTWDALRRLSRAGVTLAAHTQTHPLLTRVPPERAEAEVTGSILDLHREVGITPQAFAYPSGAVDETVASVVKPLAPAAFTTERGLNDVASMDWSRIRRINVGSRSTSALIRAQLLSWG